MKDSTKKVFKITGKILNSIFIIALSIVLIFCLYIVFSKLVLKNDLPKVFGYASAVVITGSMGEYPAIDDMVIIKEQDSYAVQDIITFRQGTMLVTHRIIDVTDSGFVTKGDANNTEDSEVVPQSAIEGKVVVVIKNVGGLIRFITHPAGMICLVAIVALLMLLPTIFVKVKELITSKNGND